jgi:2-keto-4-pentenoate hydratase/2-oxohepta-3-ene-1,7-dioic acid hydratase in catechol pathway
MKIRRVIRGGTHALEIGVDDGWADVRQALDVVPDIADRDKERWSSDAVALLNAPDQVRARLQDAARDAAIHPLAESTVALPFTPRSFRDFMLYEQHAIDAARGFVRTYLPRAWPIVKTYERVLGAPFPLLKPTRLWYRQPIYYMGNYLAFAGDGDAISIPSYSAEIDFELELGFVLKRALFNASPDEAEAAIGGFVVVNDFSARDVQRDEMRSGFGPQKSKHFRNAMSGVLVSADEILPRWQDLQGSIRINGALVSGPSSAGAHWSLGQALAHASRSEQLHPGELFATGTLPGGSGIEAGRMLSDGDAVEIAIEGVGLLRNTIRREG